MTSPRVLDSYRYSTSEKQMGEGDCHDGQATNELAHCPGLIRESAVKIAIARSEAKIMSFGYSSACDDRGQCRLAEIKSLVETIAFDAQHDIVMIDGCQE